jgi:hypothetical protein
MSAEVIEQSGDQKQLVVAILDLAIVTASTKCGAVCMRTSCRFRDGGAPMMELVA